MTDERRFGGGDESRVQALMAENERLREQIAWTLQRCNEALGVCFVSEAPNSAVAAVCDEVQRLRDVCDDMLAYLRIRAHGERGNKHVNRRWIDAKRRADLDA